MRFWMVSLALVVLVGCGKVSDTAKETASKMVPTSAPTPEAHPVQAADVAKEVGFPLLQHPLQPPVAMESKAPDGTRRIELDQVTKDTPAQVAEFYKRKLGLQVQRSGDAFSIQGEADGGNFVLMQVGASEGKTAVKAKILR